MGACASLQGLQLVARGGVALPGLSRSSFLRLPGTLTHWSGTMGVPQILASPSRLYLSSIPTRFRAPHKREESPTSPIISQTSIVQTLPRTLSTMYIC